MSVVKKIVRTYIYRYGCDECGEGELEWRIPNVMEYGKMTRYRNVCNNCGAVVILDDCYPKTVQVEESWEE